MSTIPVLTLEQQTSTLAAYMPQGRAFEAVHQNATIARGLIEGLSGELLRVDAELAYFREQILPDETIAFIGEWESAVGIPDDCFAVASDIDTRRRNVLIKLVSLGVQTQSDFVTLADRFGFAVTVAAGITRSAFVGGTDAEARKTIVVTFSGVVEDAFPYTFPFTFSNPDANIVQCLFNRLAPANVQVLYEFLP